DIVSWTKAQEDPITKIGGRGEIALLIGPIMTDMTASETTRALACEASPLIALSISGAMKATELHMLTMIAGPSHGRPATGPPSNKGLYGPIFAAATL